MSEETGLDQIEQQIRQLPPDQQLRLGERIVRRAQEGNIAALEQIEREIEQLPPDLQRKLMGRVFRRLNDASTGPKEDLDWDKLYGRGKGLWNGEDAQEYVNRMREDRKCP